MNSVNARASIAFLILFFGVDCFLWYGVVIGTPSSDTRLHFLDVGQGDSELLVLPGGVKIMTDAGPTRKVLESISRVVPEHDQYIDLAIISHPQLDHFNGFNFLLDHYRIGAVVTNGRDDTKGVAEWPALLQKLEARHIPVVVLRAGDRVRYGDNVIDFISPTSEYVESGELNDTGLVELVTTPTLRALLTADIGENIEQTLAFENDHGVDVLKVAHHGSRYSSSMPFLRALHPAIAVIEVGAGNRYGHPAPETLLHLASSGIPNIFRTDRDGTVTVLATPQKLSVFTHQ